MKTTFFQAKEPKQTISLSTLTVSLAPEKINHSHGLQLSFMTENLTRQIYLYADDARVRFHIVVYVANLYIL